MNIEWSEIEKVLSGMASKEESDKLDQWLSENPDKRDYFEKIKNYYDDTQREAAENATKRMSRHSVDTILSKKKNWKSLIGVKVATIAASIISVIALFEGLPSQLKSTDTKISTSPIVMTKIDTSVKVIKDNGDEYSIETFNTNDLKISENKNGIASNGGNQIEETSPIEYYTVSVPTQKSFSVTLADGSKIQLNAGSKLRFPNYFKKGSERKVYLSGEGYFEVQHNEKQKFIVNVENVNVVVYGTTFNINSYNDNIETVLVDGSVAIELNNRETKIQPNEKATISKLGENLTVMKVNAEKYTSWRLGFFSFENEKLCEITKSLENWYGCTIKFDNQIVQNELFSCNVEKSCTIDDFLTAIGNTNKIRYRKENNYYLIW